jgi:pyruvate formate lyase activating enzyme
MTDAGIVFQIKRFAIHDGPGIRTTVFLKGCPMSCEWCHNPEGQASVPELMTTPSRCIRCLACVDACPDASRNGQPLLVDHSGCKACGSCEEVCYAGVRKIVGEETSVADLVHEIDKDRAFYDESGGGVTFSGGEPLQQSDFVSEVLTACSARGIRTAVDTCGYAEWRAFEDVMPSTDLFLYDIKIMSEDEHLRHTGVSNGLVLDNLRRLSKAGADVIIRSVVIPGVTDKEENWSGLREYVGALPRRHHVELLPFHRIGVDKYSRLGKFGCGVDAEPPSRERMQEIALFLGESGISVATRG